MGVTKAHLPLGEHIRERHGRNYQQLLRLIVVGTILSTASYVGCVLKQSQNAPTLKLGSPHEPIERPGRAVLLFLGDSLTELGTDQTTGGWITLLQNHYSRSADIIVRGLSGYNTRWFLKYAMPDIEREIRLYTPTLVTIWFGTNDAALPGGSNSEHHVPLDVYVKNLKSIVRTFRKQSPDVKILLITPPHVDDDARRNYAEDRDDERKGELDRTNAAAGRYARACVEAAMAIGVPVLNLHEYFNAMPESTRSALLTDGLHFTTKGNKLVEEQLQDTIRSEFPSVLEALRSWQFPAANKWVQEDPCVLQYAG